MPETIDIRLERTYDRVSWQAIINDQRSGWGCLCIHNDPEMAVQMAARQWLKRILPVHEQMSHQP